MPQRPLRDINQNVKRPSRPLIDRISPIVLLSIGGFVFVFVFGLAKFALRDWIASPGYRWLKPNEYIPLAVGIALLYSVIVLVVGWVSHRTRPKYPKSNSLPR